MRAPSHFAAQLVEHAFDLWQEHGQENNHHHERHRANEAGVGHTSNHLLPDRLLLFEEVDDLAQDRAEVASRFACLDHIGDRAGEIFSLTRQCAGQCRALAQVAPDRAGQLLLLRIAQALAQNTDRVAHWQAGRV